MAIAWTWCDCDTSLSSGDFTTRLRQRRTRGITTVIHCATTVGSKFCSPAGVWPSTTRPCYWSAVQPSLAAGPKTHRVQTLCPGVKVINGIAPSYINHMLQPILVTLQRQVTLRSVINSDLVVPRSRLQFAEHAFSVAAPCLWNSLPVDIRNTATLHTFKNKHLLE